MMGQDITIQVFVENEAGSQQKNIYDENTLVYLRTVNVNCAYPYPYGFVLNTQSGDGDALDCHIITDRPLKSGETLICNPLGVMRQIEDQLEDHKILAVPVGEQAKITAEVENTLTEFARTVFADIKGKQMRVGNFSDQQAAIELIRRCQLEGS